MKIDIARQPLVPAFLTLAALATAAMWGAGSHSGDTETLLGLTAGSGNSALQNATEALAVSLPETLLAQFQTAHPVWSRWIAGALILFTGMSAGRLGTRYNLYSVGSCLAIPLYAVIACGLAVGNNFLAAFSAPALLILALKNFCRSYSNGYSFDAVFRASLYLGLLPLVSASSLPMLLMLPIAVLLFRRTLREVVVAVAGLLLPVFILCYVNWGAGGAFFAPLTALSAAFWSGAPLMLFTALPLPLLALSGGILLLDLLCILFFLSDIYAVGSKPRLILIFNIGILILTAAVLCGPAANRGSIALMAVPSAALLPFMFVRIHRAVALPLYLLMLASTVISTVLQ